MFFAECHSITLTRKEVYAMVKSELKNGIAAIITVLQNKLSSKIGYEITIQEQMRPTLSALAHQFRTKYEQSSRTESVFFKMYTSWFATSINISFTAVMSSTQTEKKARKSDVGRPTKSFMDSSDRAKRRRTEEIRKSATSDELLYATQMSLRNTGQLDASKIVKDVMEDPEKASEYRKSLNLQPETPLSGDHALSHLLECKLSKENYSNLRRTSKENNCKLYPSYSKVLDAKKKCYPPKTSMTFTESNSQVDLQELLNHTAERILLLQSPVLNVLLNNETSLDLELIIKWGCDGSSGHSEYKQTFSDGTVSDSSMFLTSMVPLQLSKMNNSGVIVWKNPRPSSPRFCRPIKLQFMRESTINTTTEVERVEQQIKNLQPLKAVVSGKSVTVNYNMAFTMIDGKVCNAISSTKSAMRCYLCDATTSEFNNIDDMLRKPIKENYLKFGLSTLHAWIRFFECCLHVSYKLEVKKWQTRDAKEQKSIQTRKKLIQQEFKTKLGLLVDQPKPGCGSSNDGNTARKFFECSEVSALITGVDKRLIERFHVILQVMSSGHAVDPDKFKNYAEETARYYVTLYRWYNMPTSVHKILIHGVRIMKSSLLPIGQLSEDAQEARNKDIRKYREAFAQKSSRTKSMEDVFCRLLATSDPYISSIRKLPTKKLRNLLSEAVALLLPPEIPNQESHTVDSSASEFENNSDNDFYDE